MESQAILMESAVPKKEMPVFLLYSERAKAYLDHHIQFQGPILEDKFDHMQERVAKPKVDSKLCYIWKIK